MSDEEPQDYEGEGAPGPEPGAPEPAKLRRRPFGYKRSDVDEALETRDSQLTELRQDVAALWLAFAQHDRMIRGLAGQAPAGLQPSERPERPESPGHLDEAEAPSESSAPADEDPAGTDVSAEEIGDQFTDLNEVLAAIEMATQTLERSYSDETGDSADSDESPEKPS